MAYFLGYVQKFLSAIALEFWISHNPEYLLIKRNLVSKFAIEVKVIHCTNTIKETNFC